MDAAYLDKELERIAHFNRGVTDGYKAEILSRFMMTPNEIIKRAVDILVERENPRLPRIHDWITAIRKAKGNPQEEQSKCETCGGTMFVPLWVKFPDGSEGHAVKPCPTCHPMRHSEMKDGWQSIPRPEGMMPCGCMNEPPAEKDISDDPEFFA